MTIAHRAGNDLRTLLAAQDAGVDLIELDVWRYRGRIEVRHLKTMGPVPLLWDRWKLANARAPRLLLGELLREAQPGTELMLDLKGTDPALPEEAARAMERWLPGRPYTVSSQSWDLLTPFHDRANVRVIYSVGNEDALRRIPERVAAVEGAAIGTHRKLLTREVAESLLRLTPTLVSWTVNDRETLERLRAWGVSGVISDRLELLQELVRERESHSG